MFFEEKNIFRLQFTKLQPNLEALLSILLVSL
jgi:hypothetical protein